MANNQNTFPNLPVSQWYLLRSLFKKSIPGTISLNYLSTVLGMTEASAKANIYPSLKQIGLIDIEGKTNQELARQLRDDNSYPKFCATILNSVYPQELRDIFPDKSSNREQIKNWFMNRTGVGESAARRLTAFYVTLLEADPTAGTGGTNNTGNKSKDIKKDNPKPKPRVDADNSSSIRNAEETDTNEPIRQQATNTQKSKGPDLNINIQIHISSDASPDQIKSIFENMAKYLYNNDSE